MKSYNGNGEIRLSALVSIIDGLQVFHEKKVAYHDLLISDLRLSCLVDQKSPSI